MGGNGCSCASAPSLPESFATGRKLTVWDLKSLNQGVIDYSEAFLVPPNNAVAVEVVVINFTVGATCTGLVQTSMTGKDDWVNAGNLTINALGPNFTIITGISGMKLRVAMSPQNGINLVSVYGHVLSR